MASKRRKQGCRCIEQMNKMLVAQNCQLDAIHFIMKGKSVAQVATLPLTKGRGVKKPPLLAATYCPFCGVKYPE